MPFTIVRNDITRMPVDAIVNAANSALAPGGGVCGAIFAAAGYEELDRACRKLGGCPTGQAVITPGFQLPAQYVIHGGSRLAGRRPWGGRAAGKLLSHLPSAGGETGLPVRCLPADLFRNLWLSQAGGAGNRGLRHRRFLRDHELEVYLVVFDRSAVTLTQQRLGSIQAYIDDHYAEQVQAAQSQRMPEQAPHGSSAPAAFAEGPGGKPGGILFQTAAEAHRPAGDD